MTCKIRKWKLSDAKDLAAALSNINVQNNLRDGLPFPYSEEDAVNYITAMLSADQNQTFAFAVTADNKAIGSISVSRQENIHRLTAEIGYYIAENMRNRLQRISHHAVYWKKPVFNLKVCSKTMR